jgi:antitoxin component of MazEF toxin-antitoxin module
MMQARIERIGDGFGLRIPKPLLDACDLGEEVSLTVRDKTLVVAPAPAPARAGWEEAIQAIPQETLDRDYEELRDFREMADEWDEKGWQWPEDEAREKV